MRLVPSHASDAAAREQLARLGAHGWELVAVLPVVGTDDTGAYELFFKRRATRRLCQRRWVETPPTR